MKAQNKLKKEYLMFYQIYKQQEPNQNKEKDQQLHYKNSRLKKRYITNGLKIIFRKTLKRQKNK
jgi:ribosomal protein S18